MYDELKSANQAYLRPFMSDVPPVAHQKDVSPWCVCTWVWMNNKRVLKFVNNVCMVKEHVTRK